MKAGGKSEMSVDFQHTTWHCIPEDRTLDCWTRCCECISEQFCCSSCATANEMGSLDRSSRHLQWTLWGTQALPLQESMDIM
jgi:hypothetical protein